MPTKYNHSTHEIAVDYIISVKQLEGCDVSKSNESLIDIICDDETIQIHGISNSGRIPLANGYKSLENLPAESIIIIHDLYTNPKIYKLPMDVVKINAVDNAYRETGKNNYFLDLNTIRNSEIITTEINSPKNPNPNQKHKTPSQKPNRQSKANKLPRLKLTHKEESEIYRVKINHNNIKKIEKTNKIKSNKFHNRSKEEQQAIYDEFNL